LCGRLETDDTDQERGGSDDRLGRGESIDRADHGHVGGSAAFEAGNRNAGGDCDHSILVEDVDIEQMRRPSAMRTAVIGYWEQGGEMCSTDPGLPELVGHKTTS
jgi:hypothetical protein